MGTDNLRDFLYKLKWEEEEKRRIEKLKLESNFPGKILRTKIKRISEIPPLEPLPNLTNELQVAEIEEFQQQDRNELKQAEENLMSSFDKTQTIINADTVIFGDAIMSSYKTGKVGKGGVVQQAGNNSNQNINPETKNENIFSNKFVIALSVILIIITLSIFSIYSLCNNKIISDKSCRILLQEIIVRIIPIASTEDSK